MIVILNWMILKPHSVFWDLRNWMKFNQKKISDYIYGSCEILGIQTCGKTIIPPMCSWTKVIYLIQKGIQFPLDCTSIVWPSSFHIHLVRCHFLWLAIFSWKFFLFQEIVFCSVFFLWHICRKQFWPLIWVFPKLPK